MSSLGAVDKALVAMEISLKEIDSGGHSLGEKDVLHLADQCIAELSRVVEPSVAKMVEKLHYKDPVTGAARYGDGAVSKILGFKDRIESVRQKCAALQEEHLNAASIDQVVAPQTTVPKKLAPVAGPIRSVDRDFDSQTGLQITEDSHKMPVDGEGGIDLEAKAKIVRERKAREAIEVEEAGREIETLLMSYKEHLEQVRRYHAHQAAMKSDTLLADPLALLLGDINQPAKNKLEALKVLQQILERIINRPDDINARRLRVTHPLLKEKLTGLVGGIEILCAVGFEARPVNGEATASADTRATVQAQMLLLREAATSLQMQPLPPPQAIAVEAAKSQSKDQDQGHSKGAVRRAADVFAFLTPHTLWDMHLEMQEPAIETLTEVGVTGGAAVKLGWLDWFDGLTKCKEAVDIAIKSLQ